MGPETTLSVQRAPLSVPLDQVESALNEMSKCVSALEAKLRGESHVTTTVAESVRESPYGLLDKVQYLSNHAAQLQQRLDSIYNSL